MGAIARNAGEIEAETTGLEHPAAPEAPVPVEEGTVAPVQGRDAVDLEILAPLLLPPAVLAHVLHAAALEPGRHAHWRIAHESRIPLQEGADAVVVQVVVVVVGNQ